jgi:hypothetical protein
MAISVSQHKQPNVIEEERAASPVLFLSQDAMTVVPLSMPVSILLDP